MENAVGSGKVSTREDRLHRGRKVTSGFLMQGWGQFANQSLLIVFLLIFHHGSSHPPYSEVAKFSTGASAVPSTTVDSAPVARCGETSVTSFTSTTTLFCFTWLKPAAVTVTVYTPGASCGTV